MILKEREKMPRGKMYIIENEQGIPLLKCYRSAVMPEKRGNRDHHHAEFEIGLIIQGNGTYRSGERLYEIKKGDIFLFSTDEHHCITEIAGKEEMIILNVQFAPRFIWSQRELFDSKLLKIFLGRNSKFENRLDGKNSNTLKIAEIVLKTEKEFQNGKAESELMVKAYLLAALVEIYRSCDWINPNGEIGAKNASYEKMSEAMDYIDKNISQELSLADIANVACMNKSYFSTLFKKLNGMSPWDYITVKRIELARKLLEDNDKNVLEIALLCGYNNTANFNRAFRAVTGKTPKDVRK